MDTEIRLIIARAFLIMYQVEDARTETSASPIRARDAFPTPQLSENRSHSATTAVACSITHADAIFVTYPHRRSSQIGEVVRELYAEYVGNLQAC